ncbi:energy transducer TonB [Brenneria populi subsp. brevivirga]|uniref:energy transducer TonB n=1 Tax=Brenneria populi TaxID=1505588 RepID=UPI002E17F76E|nr:energy transducer TonB [Brenneria populi subsp. brevivirga]
MTKSKKAGENVQQASIQRMWLEKPAGAAYSPLQYAEPKPVQPHHVTPPVKGKSGKIVLSFLTVAVLHTVVIAWLITRTTEYKPLNLVNPTESVSIQAAMIEEVEPEPVPEIPPVPPVLTSEQGEREIASVVETRETPAEPPLPVKQEVKKSPPKPVDKPRAARPKTVINSQPVASTAQNSAPAPAAAATSNTSLIPNAGKGNMMQNTSGARPKNVTSVGCAVPQPEYPRRARRLQQEGEVLIRLIINPEGRLLKHEIARSSGYEALDQAAMTAISQTRCTPYRENGQAITVMTLQPVKFKLSR